MKTASELATSHRTNARSATGHGSPGAVGAGHGGDEQEREPFSCVHGLWWLMILLVSELDEYYYSMSMPTMGKISDARTKGAFR